MTKDEAQHRLSLAKSRLDGEMDFLQSREALGPDYSSIVSHKFVDKILDVPPPLTPPSRGGEVHGMPRASSPSMGRIGGVTGLTLLKNF
jgi:hypothetical protein